jgi:large subunit ribosomal protein L16
MLMAPRKTKYRKSHKLTTSDQQSVATKGNRVSFGSYGIQSMDAKWITARQLESARRAISRYTARGGKTWIRVFPHLPVTMKSAEVGMGKGKGAVDHYVVNLKAGQVLFEIDGVTEEAAREAFRLAGSKLPVKTKFVISDNVSSSQKQVD